MDPIKKPGIDSGAPEEEAAFASCMLLTSNLVWGRAIKRTILFFILETDLPYLVQFMKNQWEQLNDALNTKNIFVKVVQMPKVKII